MSPRPYAPPPRTAPVSATVVHICGHARTYDNMPRDIREYKKEVDYRSKIPCRACRLKHGREMRAEWREKEQQQALAEGWPSLEAKREARGRAWAEERKREEAEEQRRELEYYRRQQGWSTKRNLNAFLRRLDAANLPYKVTGPSNYGSYYVKLGGYPTAYDRMEFRFADHRQPAFGGYKGRGPMGDERYGESDFSVDPWTGNTWREAIDYLLQTLLEQEAEK